MVGPACDIAEQRHEIARLRAEAFTAAGGLAY